MPAWAVCLRIQRKEETSLHNQARSVGSEKAGLKENLDFIPMQIGMVESEGMGTQAHGQHSLWVDRKMVREHPP